MRVITMWFAGTAAVVALLFSYRTSTMGPARPMPAAAAPGPGTPGIVIPATPQPRASLPPDEQSSPRSGSDPSSAAPPPASAGTVAKSGATLIVNGSSVNTIFGPVQVQVQITSGKITDVTALQAPGGFSKELTALAVPRLRSWTLTAQSSDIDVVTGATQTSEGYRTSLQAALDAAHFQSTP